MSENDENKERQVLKVRVGENATDEERKKAIKDAMYETTKARVVEEYEKLTGKSLEGSDEWTPREFENYASLVADLKEKGISGIRSHAPKGGDTATLNDAQRTGRTFRSNSQTEYDNTEDMIRDLRYKSRAGTPIEKAEADAILEELWKKWGRALHDDVKEETRTLPLSNYDGDKDKKRKLRQGA